jgi:hypothetical protein
MTKTLKGLNACLGDFSHETHSLCAKNPAICHYPYGFPNFIEYRDNNENLEYIITTQLLHSLLELIHRLAKK